MERPTGSVSPVGRELDLYIGTTRGKLIKTVLTNPTFVRLARRYWKHAAVAAVALRLALRYWRKRQERLAMEAYLRGMSQGEMASQVAAGGGGIPAAWRPSVISLVKPKDGSHIIAQELSLSCFLTAVSSLLMIRKAHMLGVLVDSGNVPSAHKQWLWAAVNFPVNAVMVTVLQEATNYLRARTVLKWRRTVTDKVHDLYFSAMGYYRLHNRGKEMLVQDPDIRICKDVKEMCSSNGSIVFSLANACVFMVMFGQAVVRDRDWRWSLVAPGFFVTAISVILSSETMERYHLQGMQAHVESRYTQLLTRMQLHAERICMLQGEKFENNLLSGYVEQIYDLNKRLRRCLFKRDTIDAIMFRDTGAPSIINMMAWVMGGGIAVNDVIAGAKQNGATLPLDQYTPYGHCPGTLGNAIRYHWAFYNACNSWGTFTSAYFTLQAVEAGNIRVQELVGSLNNLRAMAKKENSKVFIDEGSVIQFDRVSVRTPSGAKLLQDLTFKVDEGRTLLICGHNGAGKSSIIRCLCALWPVTVGKIIRPGGATSAEDNVHLHNEMYYLPQKPCNVLGSLSDQLTYPEKHDLAEGELRRWLRYVDLEYLADRKIGADTASRVSSSILHRAQDAAGNDIDWEVLLSLGEQQALSIARMLYHRPRFAILDECTSAVGKVLERRLFEITREIGISCISITHRPALKEHHEQMLMLTGKLAQDEKGWELTELPVKLSPMKPRPDSMEQVHHVLEAYMATQKDVGGPETTATDHELLERRSAEYVKGAAAEEVSTQSVVYDRWPSSLARFVAVMKLGLRTRQEKLNVLLRSVLLVAILRVKVSIMWTLVVGQLSMPLCAIIGDKPRLYSELIGNVIGICANSALEQWFILEAQNLFQDLWRGVSVRLQGQMMEHATFMKVMNPPGPEIPLVENPMQRLAEMQNPFNMVCWQVINISIAMAQALFTLRTSFRGVGFWTPVIMVMNYVTFRGAQLIAPDFTKIQSTESTLESRFQVLHTRLKAIAEPVAFSGAGAAERRIVEPRFEAVIDYQDKTLVSSCLYNCVVTFFTDYGHLPIWVHRLASKKYISSNNPTNTELLTPTNVMSNVLFDQTTRMQQLWIQKMVLFVPEWLKIDAYFTRILEMAAAFEAAGKWSEEKAAKNAPLPDGPASGRIAVSGLDLVTKRGSCLVRGLTVEIQEGMPTLVTGPNATGKSLLGSVLLGLWAPAGKDAQVSLPGATGPRPPLGTIMPAPQRIYLPVDNLFMQLCYPRIFPKEELALLPLRLVLDNLPEDTAPEALHAHFWFANPLGLEFPVDAETGKPKGWAIASFPSRETSQVALGKPQDRNLGGKEFDVDYLWSKDEGVRLLREAGGDLLGEPASFPSQVRARQCIRATGIEHVLHREQEGWWVEHPWEDVLSGGEQQRLCFARVLFHAPTFALLDECTSMVAADAEADLYRVLFKWGITPLTLTQRTFMPDLYVRELRLGVSNPDGWECTGLAPATAA